MSLESYAVPVSMNCHWHVLEKLGAEGGCCQGTLEACIFCYPFFFPLLCLMALLY